MFAKKSLSDPAKKPHKKTKKSPEKKSAQKSQNFFQNFFSKKITKKIWFRILTLAATGLVAVGAFHGLVLIQAQQGILTDRTVNLVSKNLGTPLQTDDRGHTNGLILGIGGENHDGGYLTDTMIVASRDPTHNSITTLGIPRDLAVRLPHKSNFFRINLLFRNEFLRTESQEQAARALADKLEEILEIPIHYFAIVDFGGFENLIDSLGGITVTVDEPIYDATYPNAQNRGYDPFFVEAGTQTLDGATALKFARSRHSSSDFDRSRRQQKIIEAIKNKMLSNRSRTNVSSLRNVFNDITAMVTTDLTFSEIIGSFANLKNLETINKFVLSDLCHSSRQLTQPGCTLYVPDRDFFDGASVLVPDSASPGDRENYSTIQDFADHIFYNQPALADARPIQILNAIEKSQARQVGKSATPFASMTAKLLVRRGFSITDAANAENPQQNSEIILLPTLANSGSDRTTALRPTAEVLSQKLQIPLISTGDFITGALPTNPAIQIFLGTDHLQKNLGF